MITRESRFLELPLLWQNQSLSGSETKQEYLLQCILNAANTKYKSVHKKCVNFKTVYI